MARDARRFDRRISVYRQTETPDGFGGSTLSGTLLSKAWADVSTVPVNKQTEYGLNQDQHSAIFSVRKHGSVDWEADDIYIVFDGKDWHIDQVTLVNRWDSEYEVIASAI